MVRVEVMTRVLGWRLKTTNPGFNLPPLSMCCVLPRDQRVGAELPVTASGTNPEILVNLPQKPNRFVYRKPG